MTTLRIIHPGTSASVQDLGRPGHADLGVATSGAADALSLRLGNRLVGNPDSAAGIEFSLSGGSFAFDHEAVIALSGVDAGAGSVRPRSGGQELPLWAAVRIGAGEVIELGAYSVGARVYLCVRGGIDVPRVLGSRSTHRGSGLGGIGGRELRAGDQVAIGAGRSTPVRVLAPSALAVVRGAIHRQVLRVTVGPHAAMLPRPLAEVLAERICMVESDSDRVGVRISGLAAQTKVQGAMITEGTVQGAIQVPGPDVAIILGPDRPTTGGYPIIATVAAADLPALGQLRPRDRVRFCLCTIEEARSILRERWALLDELLPPIREGNSR